MAEEYIKKSDIQYWYYPIAPILKGGSIVWRHIAFMSEIDTMRPADVVEVVRCKDCKWRNTIGCDSYVASQDKRCCEDDDFCKWGERKDNEID